MAEPIEIGANDLVTVAQSAMVALLDGIEVDGAAIPFSMGSSLPESLDDLPLGIVSAPTEVYSQGNGLPGQRRERIDVTFRVSYVDALVGDLDELERRSGVVRAAIKQRFAANPNLKVGGRALVVGLSMQRVERGAAVASKTVYVASIYVGGVIHHIEGSDEPLSRH